MIVNPGRYCGTVDISGVKDCAYASKNPSSHRVYTIFPETIPGQKSSSGREEK
jgi:hypothetical protein